MEMFELISAVVRYFVGGIKEWYRCIDYQFQPPCVKRMQHRFYCKWFSALRITEISVVIEYYKRILINPMNTRLHGIW